MREFFQGRVGSAGRRRWVLGRLLSAALVVMAVGPRILPALDASRAIDTLLERTWATGDGLPQNGVLSLAQTSDGFLWIGTQEGLARFDGVEFKVFDRSTFPWFEDQFISALAVGAGRTLWVGTRDGLVRIDGGDAARFGTAEGLPTSYVRSLAAAPDGTLWIGTYGQGLARLSPEGVEVFDEERGLRDPYVRSVAVGRDGTVWAGTSRGLARVEGEAVRMLDDPAGPRDSLVRALLVDERLRLWVGTEGRGLLRSTGGVFERLAADRISAVSALAADSDGSVWATAEDGLLVRFDAADAVQARQIGSPTALLADSEGSLWVGSNAGLVQLKDSRARIVGGDGRPGELAVRTVQQSRAGRIWVGSDGGGVQELRGEELVTPAPLADLATTDVRSVLEDETGALWIGTRNGLVRLENGRIRGYSVQDGLPHPTVNALASAADGRLWVGTAAGVAVWDEDGLESDLVALEPLAEARIRALLPDAVGGPWVGTETGLLVAAGEGRLFDRRHGLASEFVLSLYQDSRERLWVGTSAGLALRRGDVFASFSAAQGVPQRAIYQILEDGEQNLWLCSSRGVHRLSSEELVAVAAGRMTAAHRLTLTEEDGLATSQCNGGSQPAGWKTADGRLLFPTQRGLAEIDLRGLRERAVPPRVVIDTVRIANQAVKAEGSVELGPEKPSLEISYTAPTFLSARSLAFRYRVDGLQDEWTYAGQRRQVFLAGLDPGDYTFRVAAASEEGIWDEVGAELEFTVRPSLFERSDVRLASLLIVALILGGLYALRMRQVRRREHVLQSLVEERTHQLQRANEVLAGLAATDALTGITNYRRFQELLQQEWRRGMRRGRSLSLVLLDIDHFKGFNDTYGHAEGDSCLRRVAQTLEKLASRQGEVVARYGGEEFAALLPETSEESAMLMAERFRGGVEDLAIPNSSSAISRVVTISAGVATLVPRIDVEPDVLFELADNALYDAKRSGRNRVARRDLGPDEKREEIGGGDEGAD